TASLSVDPCAQSRSRERTHLLDVAHLLCLTVILFFFTDTATPEIYTLSLHDALPICNYTGVTGLVRAGRNGGAWNGANGIVTSRSEEHTSELQSRSDLVCRLLLEKKKTTIRPVSTTPSTAASTIFNRTMTQASPVDAP